MGLAINSISNGVIAAQTEADSIDFVRIEDNYCSVISHQVLYEIGNIYFNE